MPWRRPLTAVKRRLALSLLVATIFLIGVVGVAFAAASDYDTNGDRRIDRDEVLAAITDYLFEGSITRDEVLEVIAAYLFEETVEPLASDASLVELDLGGAILDPPFSASVTDYTATVENSGSAVVSARPKDPAATVTITAGGTEDPGGDVELTPGENTITVKVTSRDATTTQTYTVTLTWVLPTPTPTPTPTPLPYATAISQEGFDCFFDRTLAQGQYSTAGCSGWASDAIHKWGTSELSVWLNPEGGQRYHRITEEVLDYLEPILGLNFNVAASAEHADVIIHPGVPKDGPPIAFLGCYDALGCARWDVDDTGTIKEAHWVVWADDDHSDTYVKSTTLHEALHALTAVWHSENFKSVMRDLNNTRLPFMLPYEEDMYRLWAEPFITPGMLASQLRGQIANTPPELTLTEPEIAVNAFLNLIMHDRTEFDVQISHPTPNCSRFDDSGRVVLTGGFQWPQWNVNDFDHRSVPFRATIDGLLITLAQLQLPVASGNVNRTSFTPPSSDTHSAVSIDYTIDVNDDGYVQGFTMGWVWTSVDPDVSYCAVDVTGSNFTYSDGRLARGAAESEEVEHLLPRDVGPMAQP